MRRSRQHWHPACLPRNRRNSVQRTYDAGGGTLSDLWRGEERGVPMAAFSAAPFVGPALGPLVGGFLSDAKGKRWLYWIQLILAGTCWILITFTVPETYAPTLLSWRAAKMRKETNDPHYMTEKELDTRPLAQRLRIFLFRPFQLLFREPIVFFLGNLHVGALRSALHVLCRIPDSLPEGQGL